MKKIFRLSPILALVSCSQVDGDRPNILIIHTDEHSFRTLSCYQERLPEDEAFVWGTGCNAKTPNIDRIADEGAICMRYYATTPVSTPSRAAMMTGRHPNETGSWHNDSRPLRRDLPTFASVLSENGYSTSYVGKWHLSGSEDKYTFGIDYNGGFDDNTYMMTGGHTPYFKLDNNGEVIGTVNEKSAAKAIADGDNIQHLTDFFTEKTLEIIDRDQDKPFCVMLSIPDPHTPDYALPQYYEMYKDLEPTIPISMQPKYVEERPLWADTGKNEAGTEFNTEGLKHYFGMVTHIDDCVGLLLDRLEEYGILDNTIVIFTADHGEMYGEHGRKNKGNPYEASTRIPFVIRYPKAITAGTVLTKAYTNEGFAPTIIGMAGVKSDALFNCADDTADFFTDNVVDQHRYSYISGEENNWVAVVDDRYKLVLSHQDEPWMVDLIEDPMELSNVYLDPNMESVARKMQAALESKICSSLIIRDGLMGINRGKYRYIKY